MRSITTVFGLAAIFGFAAGSAMAETYTFVVADGNWNVRLNWYPADGPPGPGDTAIIQGERHCHVTTYSTYCKILRVLDGAILTLEAPCWLKIGDPYVLTTSVLGGEIHFEGGEGNATLLIEQGGVRINSANGGGLITAKAADGYGPGMIGTC